MIFTACSNDRKMSSMLCRSVLGVRRDYFRPPIMILTTPGQIDDHILISQKSPKMLKNVNFDKNSILDIVADIVRGDHMWPEMDSLGVLEVFCTENRYPNAFRSNFRTFSKNRFFCDFHLWDFPISASQNILWVSKFLYDIRNRFSYLKSVSDSKGGVISSKFWR